MIELSDLNAVIDLTGEPRPRLLADVSVVSDDPDLDTRLLYADVSLSDSLMLASRPRGAVQHVGFRVTIGGVELPQSKRLYGLQVSRSLGEGSTWSFSVPLGSSTPPFDPPIGTIQGYRGPPPGLSDVTIDGVYKDPSGIIVSVRILTDGVVHQARQTHTGSQKLLSISGVGPIGRYDYKKISIELPPGMGLDRAKNVVRRMAALAGVSKISLSSGGKMYKEVSLLEETWLGTGRDLMRPSGRVIQWDYLGHLTNPLAVRTAGRYDHVLNMSDILAAGVDLDSTSSGPTAVKVTGYKQVVREGDCGIVTEAEVVETWGYYEPKTAAFKQGSTGTLTDVSNLTSTFLSFRLIGVLYKERQTQCGDIISERTIEAEWFWPSSARYTLASGTDKSIGGYVNGAYIADSTAVKDDAAPAYAWLRERFVTTRDEQKFYVYDQDGYLVRIDTRTGGWVHKRAPVKEQPPPPKTPWEEVGYTSGQEILSNGEGVAHTQERRYGVLAQLGIQRGTGQWAPGVSSSWDTSGNHSESVTSYQITQDGFLQQESTETRGWLVRSATGDYWYDKEGESPDVVQRFDTTETEVKIYVAHREGGHDEIVRKYNPDGEVVEGESRLGLEGYLPSATKRTGGKPDSSFYEEGEDPNDARFSSREEAQRIEGSCSASGLELYRPSWQKEMTSEWGESVEELELEACTELRLLTALKATWSMPAYFQLREGQRVRINIPGYPLSVHVKRVEHIEGAPGSITATSVQGDVYVV